MTDLPPDAVVMIKAVMTAIERLRFQVRLLGVGIAFLVIAFLIHVLVTVAAL